MPSIDQIKNELEDVETLKGISSALLEVSSLRIKGLRDEFEKNQQFYADVSQLYTDVKLAAKKRHYALQREETIDKIIHVAITSNKRFYGSLNKTVMDSFRTNMVEDSGIDYLVIGNTGRHYLEDSDAAGIANFATFKDDYPTPRETEVFLERVRPYGKVVLYYPAFGNIFKQTVEKIDITYTSDIENVSAAEYVIEQIYEPELPHILTFFETQVRHLLFQRIMLESELSRTAARLVKMSSTEERAEDIINQKRRVLRKENMVIEDIRLLETFTSTIQWKKQH